MKKLRSLPAAKVFAVLLLTACVIGVPCLGYLLIDSASQCRGVNQISDFWNYHYTESADFSNDVNLRLRQLTEYLKLKEVLETDGNLDYNKVAVEVYTSNGKEEYTIGDLLKYNQSNYGFYSEEVMPNSGLLRESFADMKRAVYPIIKSKSDGSARAGDVESAEFITDFTKNEIQVFSDLDVACRYYQAWWELEESSENDDLSLEENRDEIAEFLNSISDKLERENTSESQSDIGKVPSEEGKVSLVSDVSYCMTYYVAYYQYYQSIFEERNTSESGSSSDFLYWISVPNQKVYTNVKESDLGANPKEEFSNHHMFGEIWYQTEDYMMKATMQIDRTKITELENLFLEAGGEKVSIHIAIPMEERDGLFVNRQENLEKLYSNILMYAGFLIFIGIAAILCICFLFYAAGHKAGYEGIYLNWFDRWYTEIAAGICVFLGVFSFFMAWDQLEDCFYSSRGYYEYLIVGCMFGFATYVIALFSFASLTRRIKAGILWKRSLTYQILKYIKRKSGLVRIAVIEMWENRSVSKKIILSYIGVIIMNAVTLLILFIFLEEVLHYYGIIEQLLCLCFAAVIVAVNFKILRWLVKRNLEFYEIYNGAERISSGDWNYKLDEKMFHGIMCKMAGVVNRIGDGLSNAIEQSIRDERMKTDLITNVSHDIKTPLTSIINYVDLLKREQFEDEKVQSYLSVLDQKSQRLKNLIDDLIEASKLSSKTVVLSIEKIDLVELVRQTNGEFAEKFAVKNLTIIPSLPEKPIYIKADGKGMWRVLENLYINVSKYAMENTRVYISVSDLTEKVEFSIKNISENPLNINASELTERFIRGDLSRSTEGSGLGLSIAKSLTELMHGTFEVYLDGDLFRTTIVFEVKEETDLQNAKKEIIIEEMKGEEEVSAASRYTHGQ